MDGNCEMCGLQNCGCEAYRLNIVANAQDDEIAKLKSENATLLEQREHYAAMVGDRTREIAKLKAELGEIRKTIGEHNNGCDCTCGSAPDHSIHCGLSYRIFLLQETNSHE
jgi:hypothetical protein